VNGIETALVRLAGFLDAASIPHMMIGGIANLRWGRPRLTQDIDVTVLVPEAGLSAFLAEVARAYTVLPRDPLEFAQRTRVIPVRDPGGVRVDLILATLPYEEEAVRRAVPFPVAGRPVRLCTAEDLILHKIVSSRPRDREDVAGIVARQGERLDREYLDPRVEALAEGLEQPEMLAFYREALRRAAAT
jgi:hypothetical protein